MGARGEEAQRHVSLEELGERMSSILNDVKKVCNVPPDYEAFDQDIILHTNSIFMVLHQLGVGPDKTFAIEDDTAEWSDFEGVDDLLAVKTYVSLRVKLLFGSSYVISAIEKQCDELEWRLCLEAEGVRAKDG